MKRFFLSTTLLLLSSVSLFSNNLEKEISASSMEEATTIFNNLVTEDTFYVQTSNCLANAIVCIDIPFTDVGNYIFMEAGNMYTNGFQGCMEQIASTYDYSQLFGQGNFGPYILDSWDVDGTIFSGEFANIPDLVDSMNLWDPSGNWILNAPSQTITGGNPSVSYFDMEATVVSVNLPTSIGLSSTSTFDGGSFKFISWDTLDSSN